MLKFFSNEEHRTALIEAHNDLVKHREDAIGYTAEDPRTSTLAVESQADMHRIESRYLTVQCRIAQKRVSVSLFSPRNRKFVVDLLADMAKYKKEYQKRTLSRSAYGILAPLAFSERESVSNIMGNPKSENTFSGTWKVQFRAHSAESPDVGLLDQIVVNKEEMDLWWFKGLVRGDDSSTNIWDDIKRMALELVYLFDKAVKHRSIGEFSTKIQNMRSRMTKLGTFLARIIYLRRENIDDIRPLFEMFIPAIYVFLLLVCLDNWADVPEKATKFLDIYISSLELGREEITTRLNAAEEIKSYLYSDIKTWDKSALVNGNEQTDHTTSLKGEIATILRSFGITEMTLNPKLGEKIGSGSYSEVYECATPDGSAILAVKYVKTRSSNERTKERIIREAERWHGLSHENINTLLGFSITHDYRVPGLVSKRCGPTLHDYVRDEHVSEIDRLVLLLQVAEALRYLHDERGLAHGDLRPANILIESELTAKLTDFGISYVEDSSVETTTHSKTNDAFLAPELKKKLQGPRQVSQKGDIFAFGCCFLDVFYVIDIANDTVEKVKKSRTKNTKASKTSIGELVIQPKHLQFLLHTWDEKPNRRPTATQLAEAIHGFMN